MTLDAFILDLIRTLAWPVAVYLSVRIAFNAELPYD